MKDILKRLSAILAMLIFMLFAAPAAFAQEETTDIDSITSSIQKKITGSVPQDIGKTLEDEGIKAGKAEGLGKIEPKGIIEKAISYFTSALRSPFILLGKMIAVSLLGVLIHSLCNSDGSFERILEILCLICTVMIITDCVRDSLVTVKESVSSMNAYLASYLPVFAGITVAGGNIVGANGYLAVMLLVCEGMGLIATKILMPFLSLILGITLVSCLNPHLDFKDVANSIKKGVIFVLGLIMTAFTGLMTIQGIVGASADSIASKAIKFTASSFIPFIGNSVSEAYSTVKGSLGMLRTTVGSIGIIVLVLIIAKPLLSILAIKFSVFLAKLVNDIFGQSKNSAFLSSVNSVLSIAMSIIIAYALIFTIATTVLMMTAFNLGG